MNEREQIINFLLQSADAKNKVIEDLQKQVAELSKQIENLMPTPPQIDKKKPVSKEN